MQYSRYINLAYALTGLIAWVLFTKASAAVMDSMEISDTSLVGELFTISTAVGLVLAVGLVIYLYVREDIRTWASEVAVELSKVTWPNWEETKRNSIVVMVFSVVLAGILASFDFFWKWLTDLILLG